MDDYEPFPMPPMDAFLAGNEELTFIHDITGFGTVTPLVDGASSYIVLGLNVHEGNDSETIKEVKLIASDALWVEILQGIMRATVVFKPEMWEDYPGGREQAIKDIGI